MSVTRSICVGEDNSTDTSIGQLSGFLERLLTASGDFSGVCELRVSGIAMALFGDSARFHEERHHCNQSNNFLKASTPSHVGPGACYSMDAEDIRSGWKSHRSPKHQPMDSLTNRGDKRGDMYINATLTKGGHIVYKDTKKHSYPSTGQYDPVQIPSPNKSQQMMSPRSKPGEEAYMGSCSPRIRDGHLRNGVLINSSPRERRRQSSLGPGSYFAADDSDSGSVLLKKSHNRRVSGGNVKGYSQHSNPSSPRARSKSTGHSRPHSAGSSRNLFKQYSTNNLKSLPSPILQTPTKRVEQHSYNYNNGRGYRSSNDNSHQIESPETPYVVSPKRGIPIGKVYN